MTHSHIFSYKTYLQKRNKDYVDDWVKKQEITKQDSNKNFPERAVGMSTAIIQTKNLGNSECRKKTTTL